MVKTSKKQKTVEYESRDIVCDLCETEVPSGQATITLVPSIASNNGTKYVGTEEHSIDVCSVDCMVKNAGAAGLLLNTKILPDLRTRLGKKHGSKLSTQDLVDMMADDDYLKKAAAGKKYVSTWSSTYSTFDKFASKVK